MSSPEHSQLDAAKHVADLLSAAAKPLTFAQLKKSTRLDDAALSRALETGAAQGKALRWPDYRRQQYFWSRPVEQAARQAVLEISSKLALSPSKLAGQARKRVPGFPATAMKSVVTSLLVEGQLLKVAAFTTGKLLIRPGETVAYARSARAFIEQKFRKAGLDPSTIFASPLPRASPLNAPELLLNAVQSLQPAQGVPVTAQRLRQHLPQLSKSELDAAALELRRNQQVFLTMHYDAFKLPPTERDTLIDGGDGTYYVSISLR
jgi:hypothetical protein